MILAKGKRNVCSRFANAGFLCERRDDNVVWDGPGRTDDKTSSSDLADASRDAGVCESPPGPVGDDGGLTESKLIGEPGEPGVVGVGGILGFMGSWFDMTLVYGHEARVLKLWSMIDPAIGSGPED